MRTGRETASRGRGAHAFCTEGARTKGKGRIGMRDARRSRTARAREERQHGLAEHQWCARGTWDSSIHACWRGGERFFEGRCVVSRTTPYLTDVVNCSTVASASSTVVGNHTKALSGTACPLKTARSSSSASLSRGTSAPRGISKRP